MQFNDYQSHKFYFSSEQGCYGCNIFVKLDRFDDTREKKPMVRYVIGEKWIYTFFSWTMWLNSKYVFMGIIGTII